MRKHPLSAAQLTGTGQLRVNVVSAANNYPVSNAVVSISYGADPEDILEEVSTDLSGQTDTIDLSAPPLEYSLEPSEQKPYADYTITVRAPGFEPLVISGSEVLPDSLSIQPARLIPTEPDMQEEDVNIPDHTLYGDYPQKIPEDEIKPVNQSGEIVLSRVVVPETIIVHDGVPSDSSAPNYYVPYIDYIKNVASSEIYATWAPYTIMANILAIQSIALNRVYTEWYRNRGYEFTITSSTAYDQKWVYGRNIFESISLAVDEIFSSYLSRPDVKQPIFTQYCDGRRITCPDWMSQWGSQSLGEQGYSPVEIIRYYYGDDMYINSAEQISGIPSSWPGYELTIGSSGPKVRQMQEQLNAISAVYTAIPSLVPDGIFGENTRRSVEEFQSVFGLPVTGVVDYRTWYKISQIFVAVTRIAEQI